MDKKLLIELRQKTGCGVGDCIGALEEAGGDIEKAIDVLRKTGLKKAEKRAGNVTKEGVITSYSHAGGKVGVLVELNCETDFVARNESFQTLAADIAMHIAASAPEYLSPEDVPTEILGREKDVLREQLKAEGKPEAMFEKILEGKLKKFYEEQCLLQQPFFKDDQMTIQELITQAIGKLGENVKVRRFARFSLDEHESSNLCQ